MKKLRLMIATLLTLGMSAGSFAQQIQTAVVPHAFKYQAVARDASGNPIANQNVSFRISILQGSANGAAVYEETQQATTSQFGLANLNIGRGNVVNGSIDDIQWGNGSYFVKIEFDPKGGTDFAMMGTSEMLSVPYAIYSEHSGTADNVPIQVALVATNVPQPVDNPPTGMIVYNSATSGTAPYAVTPGLYYNAGTPTVPNWVSLSDGGLSKGSRALPPAGCNTNTTYGGVVADAAPGTCAGTCAGTGSLRNSGFGDSAMNNTMTGTDNTGEGYFILHKLSSGISNSAIGVNALSVDNTGSANTGIGYNALTNNTSGSDNTGVGYDASESVTTGTFNTTLGYSSGISITTGSYNVGVGYLTGTATTGLNNTAVGTAALRNNTSSSSNTAVGYTALYTNTTSDFSSAFGDSALYNNTAAGNTAVGAFSLLDNISGTQNAALGYEALYNNTGSDNTASGFQADLWNTTGDHNTAVGDGAAYENRTGSYNTAVGNNALFGVSLQSNSGNTGIGYEALYGITTGDSNTSAGVSALATNTTGNANTALGYGADVSGSSTFRAATAIGFEAVVNESNAMVLGGLNSDFEFVGIGVEKPLACLHLADAGSTNSNCHIKSSQTNAPTISTYTNITVAPTLSSGSTDTKGTIMGTGNSSGASTVTVAFNKSYNVAPVVLITAINANGGTSGYYVSASSTTSFTLTFTQTPGTSQGEFNYFVIE